MPGRALIARSGPVRRGAALRPGPVPDKTKKAHLSMRLFLETIPVMQRPCPGQGQHRTPASVDSVLQRLARLEARDAGSGNLNGLSSLGIAAHARCPLLDRKAAKAYEGDLAATFQGLGNRFDHCVQCTTGGSLGQVRRRSNRFDQFGFIHTIPLWQWYQLVYGLRAVDRSVTRVRRCVRGLCGWERPDPTP